LTKKKGSIGLTNFFIETKFLNCNKLIIKKKGELQAMSLENKFFGTLSFKLTSQRVLTRELLINIYALIIRIIILISFLNIWV